VVNGEAGQRDVVRRPARCCRPDRQAEGDVPEVHAESAGSSVVPRSRPCSPSAGVLRHPGSPAASTSAEAVATLPDAAEKEHVPTL
jgi:hypothetical protein